MTFSFRRIIWPDPANQVQGLIRFRWIAIFILLLGIGPLVILGAIQKQDLNYFFAVIGLLTAFNILSQKFSKPKPTSRALLVHLCVDLLAAAGLLFSIGSANNPFIFVFCIHGFLGGLLLRQRMAFLFACLLVLTLSILQIEAYRRASFPFLGDRAEMYLAFLSQWSLLFSSWFVSQLFSGLIEKQEERIRLLQNRQHQADRLKSLGALTAGFSHQLATPLNTLKLRMDRGLRKLPADEVGPKEEFLKAQESLEECISIFQHMASVFSRSSEGEPQRMNITQILADLIKVWEKENGHRVQQEIESRQYFCRLHILSFSQTIFDMLDNALEASKSEGTIQVHLFGGDGFVRIEIKDQGSGISEEILSRIGEPFVTSKVQGNGLGVYSAQMMVQSVGGEFALFNDPEGPGAVARLDIPLEVGE